MCKADVSRPPDFPLRCFCDADWIGKQVPHKMCRLRKRPFFRAYPKPPDMYYCCKLSWSERSCVRMELCWWDGRRCSARFAKFFASLFDCVRGSGPAVKTGEWHTLSLTTVDTSASASVDGTSLFANATIRNIDTGFAAIGLNTWFHVEFDNLKIEQAGGACVLVCLRACVRAAVHCVFLLLLFLPKQECAASLFLNDVCLFRLATGMLFKCSGDSRWGPAATAPPAGCSAPSAGRSLSVRPCVSNGLSAADQQFELLADWQLRHIPSGLCAQYTSDTAAPTLEACDFGAGNQQFRNDYTRIRNTVVPIELTNLTVSGKRILTGSSAGTVSTPKETWAKSVGAGTFNQWAYFPNTFQLRNQYTGSNPNGGYPMCLSACPPPS